MCALFRFSLQVVAFERQNETDAAEEGVGRRCSGGRAAKVPSHLGNGLAHDCFFNLCESWRRDWRWDGRAPESDYELSDDGAELSSDSEMAFPARRMCVHPSRAIRNPL